MPRLVHLFAFALIATTLASTAPTQDAGVPNAGARSERIVFDDRGGMSLKDFVRWVTDVLDRPIIYAPAAHEQLKATASRNDVRFNRSVTIARADVMKFALKTLFMHRMTIVDLSSKQNSYLLLESLQQPTVLKTYRRHVDEKELARLTDTYVFVSHVMALKHADIQMLQSQVCRLCPHASPTGRAVIPLPSQNSVVLIGFAPEVSGWRKVLQDLDVPPPAIANKKDKPTNLDSTTRLRLATMEARLKRIERVLADIAKEQTSTPKK